MAANFWIFFLMPVTALMIINKEVFPDFFIECTLDRGVYTIHFVVYGPNLGLINLVCFFAKIISEILGRYVLMIRLW